MSFTHVTLFIRIGYHIVYAIVSRDEFTDTEIEYADAVYATAPRYCRQTRYAYIYFHHLLRHVVCHV